jgi:site-specific DNA recombinase
VDLIGYIRVSRVAGREGDSFISPSDQRDRIAAYATAKGHQVIDFITDLDESGGKIERPGFQAALARCEAGEAEGVIVAKLDRFARSLADAAATVRRLDAAGCALVSVADDIDASGPSGKLMRAILFAFAEFERDRINESWATAKQRAIGRGVHVGKAPIGYIAVDGKLEVDPTTAATIKAAFEARAGGASMTEVARLLDSMGTRYWTLTTATSMLRNRTYLGEVRHGTYTNPSAHEPLVSLALFAAANARKPVAAIRADSTGRGALLTGLVRCAGCRYSMPPTKRGSVYACKANHGSGVCPAPTSIKASSVEEYVVGFIKGYEYPDKFGQDVTPDDLAALEAAVSEAESDVTAYLAIMKATDPGFRSGYDAKVTTLNHASAALTDAARRAQARGVFDWESLTLPERRDLLRATLQAIFIRKGSRYTNLQDRVAMVWATDPLLADLPSRGRLTPLRSYDWDSHTIPS